MALFRPCAAACLPIKLLKHVGGLAGGGQGGDGGATRRGVRADEGGA
jgi:hypothetical protein